MKLLRAILCGSVLLSGAMLVSTGVAAAQAAPAAAAPIADKQGADNQSAPAHKSYPPSLVQSGRDLFRQDCSFCHGRDVGGGETGPDLTRSKLVTADVDGEKISVVVRNGRPDKGMPPFDRSEEQIASLVAYIHTQQNRALTRTGGRKGVDVSDLQTGNVEAGKRYFEGAGDAPPATRRPATWLALIRVTAASNSKSKCCIRDTRNLKSR